MGKISRIVKGLGSGLVSLARQADKTIGSFERIFGRFEGPSRGMAGKNTVMKRLAQTGTGKKEGSSLADKVSIRNRRDREKNKRRFL